MKKIISVMLSMILIITNVVYKSNICFAGKGDDQITSPKSSNEDIEFQKSREERLRRIETLQKEIQESAKRAEESQKRIEEIQKRRAEIKRRKESLERLKAIKQLESGKKPEKKQDIKSTKEEIQVPEKAQNENPEEIKKDEKFEEANSDAGLTLEDLVKVDSDFEKYVPYIEKISKDIIDPQFNDNESILQNQGKSLDVISQKLSCVCNKILKTGTEKALKPHSVQLLAVLKLVESVLTPEDGMKGSIGNIRTGEGKSFIIALVAIILQSYGQKIDIVTSNMELATRDWQE